MMLVYRSILMCVCKVHLLLLTLMDGDIQRRISYVPFNYTKFYSFENKLETLSLFTCGLSVLTQIMFVQQTLLFIKQSLQPPHQNFKDEIMVFKAWNTTKKNQLPFRNKYTSPFLLHSQRRLIMMQLGGLQAEQSNLHEM